MTANSSATSPPLSQVSFIYTVQNHNTNYHRALFTTIVITIIMSDQSNCCKINLSHTWATGLFPSGLVPALNLARIHSDSPLLLPHLDQQQKQCRSTTARICLDSCRVRRQEPWCGRFFPTIFNQVQFQSQQSPMTELIHPNGRFGVIWRCRSSISRRVLRRVLRGLIHHNFTSCSHGHNF